MSEKFAPSHSPTFGPLVLFLGRFFLHMCRVCRFDRKLGFEKSRENESARRLNRLRFSASKASRIQIYTRVIFSLFIFLSSFFSLPCLSCLSLFLCVPCLAISSACRPEHTSICLHVSFRYEHCKLLAPAKRG